MMTRRLKISLTTGAVLGLFCVTGARFRGTVDSTSLLFALWYNRIIMALLIGVIEKEGPLIKRLLRGAVLGFLVSLSYFASVGFNDLISFLAGIVYGVIIEYVLFRLEE